MSSEHENVKAAGPKASLTYLGHSTSEPRHPALVGLLAHWRESGGENGALPPRTAFEPHKIKRWLTRIYLAAPEGQTYRYRVFGSGLEYRLGVFAHRRTVRDVWPDETAARTEAWFARVIGSREPIVLHGHMKSPQSAQVGFECLLAPIHSTTGDVWVIGCLCAEDEGA